MISLRTTFWDIAYLMVLLVGLAVAAFHASIGLYHMAVIATGMVGVGFVSIALEGASAARMARAGLALTDRAALPVAPATVRVISADGACAMGYRPGNSWAIDATGTISPRLCQSAVAALGPLLLARSATERGGEGEATCRCPLADRRVMFRVSNPAASAA